MKYQNKYKLTGLKEKSRRIFIIKIILLIGFLLVSFRLVQIQVFKSSDFQKFAKRQYEAKIPLSASRGNIYDRNGNILASNTTFTTFAIDPSFVSEEEGKRIVSIFSKVFNKPKKYYLDKIRSEKKFEYLERCVLPSYRKFIENEQIKGLIVIDEQKRIYHYGSLAGQVLGGTNIDNEGVRGIELFADDFLKGKNGYMILQRDGWGRAKVSVEYPRIEPENGNHLYLTIDLAYQSIAEEEIKRGVEIYKADGGIAVLLKPSTSEILAIAQYPGFNPNNISNDDIKNQRIRAITDMFEPGSVFKLVTASAALEQNSVKPNQRFNAEKGKYKIVSNRGSRTITDVKPFDYLTFKEAIEYSSNIVMAKISDIIGQEALFIKARDFGFGSLTYLELPAESKGVLKKPKDWSGTTLNTMSYGYEVSATPIQIVSAYSAVANKGVLMKPYLISKVVNENDEVVFQNKPVTIRRVVSEKTAEIITEFFEGVIERGTATATYIEGFRIAGKTGTARQMIDGKYTQKKFFANFIGYFPVENPQIVCLIMLDNPTLGGYTGGTTSAPIFKNIADRISMTNSVFTKTNIVLAVNNEVNNETIVPDLCNLQLSIALKVLESQDLIAESFGTGKVILEQDPDAGEVVPKGSKIRIMFSKKNDLTTEEYALVPNVVGLPLRRAINRLSMDGFEIKYYGNGIVISQSPESGQNAISKTVVSLHCENNKNTENQ